MNELIEILSGICSGEGFENSEGGKLPAGIVPGKYFTLIRIALVDSCFLNCFFVYSCRHCRPQPHSSTSKRIMYFLLYTKPMFRNISIQKSLPGRYILSHTG